MKSFFKTYSKKDSHALTSHLAQRFAERAGPYREELEKAIREKDFAALANFDLDYSRFSNASDVYGARSCLALYQKCDDYDLGIDREAVAYAKFRESEVSCKAANSRIREYSRSNGRNTSVSVSRTLQKARDIVAQIIGSSPPAIGELQLSFGPGASSNVSKNTSARWKLSAKPACSANMASTVCDVLATMPHYCDLHNCNPEPRTHLERVFWDYGLKNQKESDFWTVEVSIEPGKLMFVPKNAKTDRSIIVEPTLNSFLQKGYGTELKRLLKRAGVNLYDQSLNQARARTGSINGRLMTVDLSSASDTICKELIAYMLPDDWYIALSSARTSHIVYTGNRAFGEAEFHLEKFSSMGNGFTFELESLVFYALTSAVCRVVGIRPDVTVYGDDIICPPEALSLLEETFGFCGFSINKSKSFSTGPFRESCGADFYNGVNVRPYYNKHRWSSATLTAFHNNLVRSGWSVMYPDVIEHLIRALPAKHLLVGPDGFGDGHLIGENVTLSHHGRDRGWSGFTFKTFVSIKRTDRGSVRGDCIVPHYAAYVCASKEETYDPFTLRGHKGSKVISIYMLGR